jgi:hypothetical protein
VDLADDADDLPRVLVLAEEAIEAFADGVAAGKISARYLDIRVALE